MDQSLTAATGSASRVASFLRPRRSSAEETATSTFALVSVVAFIVYWLSSIILLGRGATTHFGGDAHLYARLAYGEAMDWLTRYHPAIMVIAVAWMRAVGRLAEWLPPLHLLNALFAAIGGLGIAAAMSAFAAVVPRRCVVPFGIVYALTLGVWYYAGIPESKILTISLTALYIAVYLNLRSNWTLNGALLLTAVLLVGCLNEIVFGFLVVLPVVDTVMRPGWNWRQGWWVAGHALAGPAALLILEVVINGWWLPPEPDPQRASHFVMLIHYMRVNDYSFANLYAFALHWFLFNIAAPSPNATFGANPVQNFSGNFEPVLANYLASTASTALVVLAGVLIVAGLLPRYRSARLASVAGILLGLIAFALVRALFFLVYLPAEPLLNSSATTLAHLLIVGIPFAMSSFPMKRTLLVAFAALLFVNNGAFILGG